MSACPQCKRAMFTDDTICAQCWRRPDIVDELLKKSPSVRPPPPIVGRTVVSAEGAAVQVTEVHLSDEARRALNLPLATPPIVKRKRKTGPDGSGELF